MLDGLFVAIDQKDTERFTSFFSEDARFRFANMPEQRGKGAIAEFVSNFFHSIEALEHRVAESWGVADAIVCRGTVTYTRLNGSRLTVPFANILHFDERGIIGYQVFGDFSEL